MSRDLLCRILIGFGIVMILISECLYWNNGIIYRGFIPMALPLFMGAIRQPPWFYPFSYGVAVFLLLGFAYIAVQLRRPVALAWAAFFLLLLGLNCPLQLGFSQPFWVYQFLQARNDYLVLTSFANSYSIPTYAPPLLAAEIVNVDSLYDRLIVALASLEIGWTIHVLGSLLFLAGALGMVGNWSILRIQAVRAGWIVLFMLAWNLTGPLLGETCFELGLKAERSAQLGEARNFYFWARVFDQWNRLNPRVYQRLGAIAQAENRVNSPEYHYVMGLRNENWSHQDPALAELLLATASPDPDLAHIARVEYADYASIVARGFYSHGGAPGTSALYWQLASNMSDIRVAQDYLAARGQQDSGEYDYALKSLTRAQGEGDDLALQSDIFSSIGDVNYFRADVLTARDAYLNSVSLVRNYIQYKNIRANKSLTDNLQP